MREDLEEWNKQACLDLKRIDDHIYEIPEIGKFLLVQEKEKLIDSEINLILDEEEEILFKTFECKYYLYSFGGIFYYSEKSTDLDFIPFYYLGRAILKLDQDFCHLGVHGGYELLNGSRNYSDWCKKAKFLGLTSLGICEKNSLSGTLSFQIACLDKGIKPILGQTVTVKTNENSTYEVKLFVKDKTGWASILKVNKEINVVNPGQFIHEKELLKNSQGLICILTPQKTLTTLLVNKFLKAFSVNLYYQIDTVEYVSEEQDRQLLFNYKDYFSKFSKILKPVLLNDSYYLEKSHGEIKKIMNSIRNNQTEYYSTNQHFKDLFYSFSTLTEIWSDDSKKYQSKDFFDWFEEMVENTRTIRDSCNFQINTEGFKLPKFSFEGIRDKYKKYEGKEIDLFWELIDEGIEKKLFPEGITPETNLNIYLERIQKEFTVIHKGGFIGYFLILWDIIDFCNKENILVGLARGSAGGSLIAYLLDITKLDPIKYDLLFERFLNEGRIKAKLPDIDTDFEASRREDVKRYMEDKYGKDCIASIGSYNTYKVKSAFQDLARVYGVPSSTADHLSKVIETGFDGRWAKGELKYYFISALGYSEFYDFCQNYPDLINNTQLLMKQPSSSSIHPCAVVIFPKKDFEGNDMTVFDWVPVRKENDVLITDWTGTDLEEMGFLKEDILGITQLDKFRLIFNLVHKHYGKTITYNLMEPKDHMIPDTTGVMEYFQKGISQDIFQFGSENLIAYTKKVQPYNLEELILINAIFRPGPIDSGAHEDYVKIKFGKLEATYDKCLEDITKPTNGLYVYQEQVMAAASKLGDFNMTEADDVRRAMGKMKASAMEPYKIRFVEGGIRKGYTEEEALGVWEKLVRFSSYGYNRSHAAAYALTAYFCQWLKAKYPLEFYTISLTKSYDDDIPARLKEIYETKSITIEPPCVNSSDKFFVPNPEEQRIYWSFLKIKQCGEIATNFLLADRHRNGSYFSMQEFFDRMQSKELKEEFGGSKVNSRVFLHLILAGAFDKIEKLKSVIDRYLLIKKYSEWYKKPLSEEEFPRELVDKEYFWVLKQRELTGLGEVDYKKLVNLTPLKTYQYVSELEFYKSEFKYKTDYCVAGIVTQVNQRIPKANKENVFGQLLLNVNDEEIVLTLWNETWTEYKTQLNKSKGKIIVVTGNIKHDNFKNKNVLYSNKNSEVLFI